MKFGAETLTQINSLSAASLSPKEKLRTMKADSKNVWKISPSLPTHLNAISTSLQINSHLRISLNISQKSRNGYLTATKYNL